MRQAEINYLSGLYTNSNGEIDRRFNSSVGADVPSADKLVNEIFNDFDTKLFGVSWWKSVPDEERILISDYLYQCANGIELNLVEAKLHYLEWLDARERQNERIADVIKRDSNGELRTKMPSSKAPIDDLPKKLEGMHICGFFRAIGSSLDCLGAVIIAALGLPRSLRRSDIGEAKKALSKIADSGSKGSVLQVDFRDFFETAIKASGADDWLEWTDQYRNMLVHRGRRITYNQIVPREVLLYDSTGQLIPRVNYTMHLAKYPDKSDAEALIKNDLVLNEDADETLKGVFKSCRDLNEAVCERLVSIWQERRNDPSLIEQPASQWDTKIRACKFIGYKPDSEPLKAEEMIGHPTLFRRLLSASVDDAHRSLWANSKWNQ